MRSVSGVGDLAFIRPSLLVQVGKASFDLNAARGFFSGYSGFLFRQKRLSTGRECVEEYQSKSGSRTYIFTLRTVLGYPVLRPRKIIQVTVPVVHVRFSCW